MRILHIGPDTQFVQFAAVAFESVAPGANEYIVIGRSGQGTIDYPVPGGPMHVVSPDARGVAAAFARYREHDLVVAHSMTLHAAAVFTRAHKKTVTVWSGWGYDYYSNDPSESEDLFGPQTRELVERLARSGASRPPVLRRTAGALWGSFARFLTRRAAARSDYFSAPVPTDEPVFRSRFPQFHGGYCQLNYANLADTFASIGENSQRRGGILIGNSATPTNNHLEAFELLAGRDLEGRQVIVPLNYGDPAYRDAVVEHGTELFGSAFVPVVDRMPLEEYNALVAGCDVVIVNTRRQQALGNIGTALYTGANVILDEANPVYGFLRSGGATVRTTAELRAGDSLFRPLEEDELAANRAFLESFWGADQVTRNVADLIGRLGR